MKKKRQNQTQSSGLKQREGGKGLSRILIMHTTHTYTHTDILISKLQLFLPKYSCADRVSYHHGDQEDVKWTARLWEVILTSRKHTEIHAVTRYVSFTELHHNHSTHTQRTQSHADRSHRDNAVLLPTPHSNAHFHMRAHILWEFMSKPSPRTHTYSDYCTHTHATCSHSCTPPDRNIYQLAHSQYALAQTGSHTHTNTDTQVRTNMAS